MSLQASIITTEVADKHRPNPILPLPSQERPIQDDGSIELRSIADESSIREEPHALPVTPRKARINERLQFAVLCWTMFLTGYNDGTTGALLPRIQEVYHVRFFQPLL